jgi:hypothetical protein
MRQLLLKESSTSGRSPAPDASGTPVCLSGADTATALEPGVWQFGYQLDRTQGAVSGGLAGACMLELPLAPQFGGNVANINFSGGHGMCGFADIAPEL